MIDYAKAVQGDSHAMKVKPNKVYQWKRLGNETPCIGTPVCYRSVGGQSIVSMGDLVLMLPRYETVGEYTHKRDILPYPSSQIEEPSK